MSKKYPLIANRPNSPTLVQHMAALVGCVVNSVKGLFGKLTKSTKAAPVKEYFSLVQVDAIHHAVNGKQIKEVSPSELYLFLNLRHSSATMEILHGERGRTCHLIYFLSEMLPPNEKTAWRDTMCERLGITKRYYLSKYRKAVSDDCTKADEKFVQAINKVNAKLQAYQG